MLITKTECKYRLLPLDLLIRKRKIRLNPLKLMKNINLSSINKIPWKSIEHFEKIGIFDTSDFYRIKSDISGKMDLEETEFIELRQLIIKEHTRITSYPIFILDLPQNYALYNYYINRDQIIIGIYWKGIEFIWKIRLQELDEFLSSEFSDIIQKMRYPELIGISSNHVTDIFKLNNIEFSDISFYVGNVIQNGNLVQYTNSFGFPDMNMENENMVAQQLMRLDYILQLAKIISQSIVISSF